MFADSCSAVYTQLNGLHNYLTSLCQLFSEAESDVLCPVYSMYYDQFYKVSSVWTKLFEMTLVYAQYTERVNRIKFVINDYIAHLNQTLIEEQKTKDTDINLNFPYMINKNVCKEETTNAFRKYIYAFKEYYYVQFAPNLLKVCTYMIKTLA